MAIVRHNARCSALVPSPIPINPTPSTPPPPPPTVPHTSIPSPTPLIPLQSSHPTQLPLHTSLITHKRSQGTGTECPSPEYNSSIHTPYLPFGPVARAPTPCPSQAPLPPLPFSLPAVRLGDRRSELLQTVYETVTSFSPETGIDLDGVALRSFCLCNRVGFFRRWFVTMAGWVVGSAGSSEGWLGKGWEMVLWFWAGGRRVGYWTWLAPCAVSVGGLELQSLPTLPQDFVTYSIPSCTFVFVVSGAQSTRAIQPSSARCYQPTPSEPPLFWILQLVPDLFSSPTTATIPIGPSPPSAC
ncbi:hypothetical protein K505DRAFT_343547 [Melanomma pulvis-pyrius CBS 109.77]|uniref:Uncharacterized protein n=1 Tax=Melanomma pulvis-pyrius CBS 109.77 TaxID=1314802 RepID=A0A6A6WS42_9PLEO|nr:hypothetical protein K505DRAFT_343547 [Melanomma pulvis-pyrius CBS 109.77]